MKKIIRILNLDIHSLNNAEYKNFMERFFKLIPLKAVSGEGDRPSERRRKHDIGFRRDQR